MLNFNLHTVVIFMSILTCTTSYVLFLSIKHSSLHHFTFLIGKDDKIDDVFSLIHSFVLDFGLPFS